MKPSFTKSFVIGFTTAVAVAVAASSATAQGMTGFSDGFGGHVFYVGTDAHIHQLYYSNAHIWSKSGPHDCGRNCRSGLRSRLAHEFPRRRGRVPLLPQYGQPRSSTCHCQRPLDGR